MGTSKITVISGIYIVIGLYTFGFNSIEESQNSSALAVGTAVQTDQLAETGISLALVAMSNNPTISSLPLCSLSSLGGRVTYSVSSPASLAPSERLITSTAIFNSSKKIASAVVHFDKGRWRVIRTYSAIALS